MEYLWVNWKPVIKLFESEGFLTQSDMARKYGAISLSPICDLIVFESMEMCEAFKSKIGQSDIVSHMTDPVGVPIPNTFWGMTHIMIGGDIKCYIDARNPGQIMGMFPTQEECLSFVMEYPRYIDSGGDEEYICCTL